MLLVREIEGPANARVGESLSYTATRFNRDQPAAAELAAINWVVKQGEREITTGRGPSFSFTPDESLAGTAVLVMAYRNSPSPNVSATTFIQPQPTAEAFQEQLRVLGRRYTELLTAPEVHGSLETLVSEATALRYDLEDLLESLGPLPASEAADADEGDEEALARPRLAVVVGHTASLSGAVAGPPIEQREYFWNRDLADMMKTAADEEGLDIKICFRDDVGIEGAYAAAEAFQPGAIIELHFNSFRSASARGTETLYADIHPASEQLASLVQERMVAALGRPDRGVKEVREGGRGYRNLSAAAAVPTVLVEPFFGSNSADCEAAHTNKSVYAQSLVAASLAFLASR